ncbi:hypothetical protein YC2023_082221 [Brassica napus]
MEESKSKALSVAVTLRGGTNYLLWSRLVKAAVGSKGLWSHISDGAPKPVAKEGEGGQELMVVDQEKWDQDDLKVLTVLHGSLEASILEAYSYCETPKDLWDTLQKVYVNISNLSRVFELKRSINTLVQEEVKFTKHLGKFRALWSELEMLRPNTTDQDVLMERREQDQVFGLLLTLNPVYNDLIKHILRSPKLPSLEDVCEQIQREEGSVGLFGGKGELTLANQADAIQANKAAYKTEEGKFGGKCDHCKKQVHKRSQCWILHPHLKPTKFMRDREARAHLSDGASEAGTSGAGQAMREGEGKALTTQHTPGKSTDGEMIRRSDIDALIKALKENGNCMNTPLGYSLAASYIDRTHGYLSHNSEINDASRFLNSLNDLPRTLAAKNVIKPLIVDSGASHHMISDTSLIKDIEPTCGNVMIANGDRIAIKGIGNLNLFDKESKAFYMPEFTSNLLSVKRCTTDLHCNVIFSPNDVKFQDIDTRKMIGKGVTKGELYMLEDIAPISNSSFSFSSISSLNNDALWHARLGHPHVRALSLMLPGVMFKNNECEACILGKHCKTVFKNSTTIYEKCFDLVHSDVWTAPCLSKENYKYFVTFIDEKSKYTWITLIKTKDRVLEAFKNFQAYVSNHYNAKLKIFRSDNGGEYTSNAFKQHLALHGILHQTSCPYTPQQNGVAERKNRHLMEVARSMMFQTNVPKRFWSDAVISACYLINGIPTRVLEDQSPFEVLNKVKPSLSHLRVFESLCYVLIPGDMRNKLEPKSTKAMFVGYSTTQRGYKCFDPQTRRLLVSRDVKFIETKGYYEERSWEDLEDLAQPGRES